MELSLHTDFPETLEAEWNALLERSAGHVPFLRYEYQRLWWQTRGGGEWPDARLALVLAHENGRLVAAAPLFYTADYQGQPRLMLVGSIEVSDYLDLLCPPQDLDRFCAALLDFLEQAGLPDWQSLDLFNILETSPTLAALERAAAGRGRALATERAYHCPYIPLPGDWETYLAGIDKKQRHEIRRKMRRLEEAAVPSRWYIVEDPAALDGEIDAFIGLMEQDADKLRFLTAPMRAFMRGVIRCAFERGCLFLAFLEIDGHKAAGYLSFDYLNRIWVYNSGIDRAWIEYSPGWVLLGYLLQWSNTHAREAFDFLRGDEEYKYRFGAVDRFVLRVTLSR